MKNRPKKKVFDFSFSLYDDNSYEENISVSPGFEKFVAELLFSMSTGQMGQSILKTLMDKQPKEAELIAGHLQKLYMIFLASTNVDDSEDERPVILPSEVLGRS